MGWIRRLVHRLGGAGSVSSRLGDQSAMGARDRDALSRWESEGGAPGAAREENAGPVRRIDEEKRARQDSMTNIEDNAMGEAASCQSAKDAAADAADNLAEQGGQG